MISFLTDKAAVTALVGGLSLNIAPQYATADVAPKPASAVAEQAGDTIRNAWDEKLANPSRYIVESVRKIDTQHQVAHKVIPLTSRDIDPQKPDVLFNIVSNRGKPLENNDKNNGFISGINNLITQGFIFSLNIPVNDKFDNEVCIISASTPENVVNLLEPLGGFPSRVYKIPTNQFSLLSYAFNQHEIIHCAENHIAQREQVAQDWSQEAERKLISLQEAEADQFAIRQLWNFPGKLGRDVSDTFRALRSLGDVNLSITLKNFDHATSPWIYGKMSLPQESETAGYLKVLRNIRDKIHSRLEELNGTLFKVNLPKILDEDVPKSLFITQALLKQNPHVVVATIQVMQEDKEFTEQEETIIQRYLNAVARIAPSLLDLSITEDVKDAHLHLNNIGYR